MLLSAFAAACAADDAPGDSETTGSASETSAAQSVEEPSESARTLLDQRILVDGRLAIASSPELQIQHFTLSVTGTNISVTASAAVTPAQLEQATSLLRSIDGVGEVEVRSERSATPPPSIVDAAEGSGEAPVDFAADQLAALADPTNVLPDPTEPTAGSGELPEQTAAAASGDRPRTYRVRAGDSLSRVAARTMGDGTQWRRIYELNRSVIGANPERLREGMELRIPQD